MAGFKFEKRDVGEEQPDVNPWKGSTYRMYINYSPPGEEEYWEPWIHVGRAGIQEIHEVTGKLLAKEALEKRA